MTVAVPEVLEVDFLGTTAVPEVLALARQSFRFVGDLNDLRKTRCTRR